MISATNLPPEWRSQPLRHSKNPLETRHTAVVQIPKEKRIPGERLIVFCGAFLVGIAGLGTTVSGNKCTVPFDLSSTRFNQSTVWMSRDDRRRSALPIPAVLAELRFKAALTWEQLATIFHVSRRAVHLWASGQRLTADNEGQIRALHAKVLSFEDRVSAKAAIAAEYGFEASTRRRRQTAAPIVQDAILTSNEAPLSSAPKRGRVYSRSAATRA